MEKKLLANGNGNGLKFKEILEIEKEFLKLSSSLNFNK
jgi:hypothetical protein